MNSTHCMTDIENIYIHTHFHSQIDKKKYEANERHRTCSKTYTSFNNIIRWKI